MPRKWYSDTFGGEAAKSGAKYTGATPAGLASQVYRLTIHMILTNLLVVYLWNTKDDNSTFSLGFLQELNELLHIKPDLTPSKHKYLAHSKHAMHTWKHCAKINYTISFMLLRSEW